MSADSLLDSYLSLITLRRIRGYIVRSHAVMMSVFIGIVYALIALTEGGMLVLGHLGGGYTTLLVTSSGTGPGFLIIAPWGVLALPIFGVVAMAFVSIGVALGMAVAVLLAVAVVRGRKSATGGPAALGSLTGLTPAMISLLALGACCSTTAAATAGIGAIAQISGSTPVTLLENNWYLSVFQVAIVWIALLAQESLLRVYGVLYGLPDDLGDARPSPAPPPLDRWVVTGTVFRAGLLIAGLSWSLAMFANWTTVAPSSAPAAVWFDWLFLHQFLAAVAIVAALFPSGFFRFLKVRGRSVFVRGFRTISLLAGLLLVVGAPPPVSAWGIEGWGNELLSWAGSPAALGAVAPVFPVGPALAFRWGIQYLFLGGFAIALAIRPAAAFRVARWSSGYRASPRLHAAADGDTGRPVLG